MSLRVVFNTWSGAFFNPGGGEVQLTCTREQLQKNGCQVDLYNQWSPSREIDVFHQFSIQPGVEYPMQEYRNMGKKVVLSTILWVEYPKDSGGYQYIRKIFNLADILMTNSVLESEKLANAFDIPIERFHKTVNGISDAYLSLDTTKNFRDHYGIEGDFLLTVANIDRRKNTHTLIEAAKALGRKVVCVGHIRDKEYYSEFSHSADLFSHVGPIEDKEMLKSAYQQAAMFVLPSLCETPGIAALEAASQGAKVVITSEGSAPEYFGSFATYVDPLSVDSVAQGIDDELRISRNRQQIRRHVCENYTWELAARQVYCGYRRNL